MLASNERLTKWAKLLGYTRRWYETRKRFHKRVLHGNWAHWEQRGTRWVLVNPDGTIRRSQLYPPC